jgi:hypothetical protein
MSSIGSGAAQPVEAVPGRFLPGKLLGRQPPGMTVRETGVHPALCRTIWLQVVVVVV